MREAEIYEKLTEKQVRCHLCGHECVIPEGKTGICGVRENREGTLESLVFGRAIALHVDPIEKKPLYHFHPGSSAYSIATAGCNFRCRWCQNWRISQMPREEKSVDGHKFSPEEIVADALRSGCRSIAYTYTEPTVFFEYARDTSRLAHASGVANVFVTNGFMTETMLNAIHPHMDGANVDLKSFRDETYRKHIGARLEPVLESLKVMKRQGAWLEVTTLVIPGINDDSAELRDLARFLAQEIGPETPWHISRFSPGYRMSDAPPTPIRTLELVREIGLECGLRYVYLGNVAAEANTHCHACGSLLIRRAYFGVLENRVGPDSCCPDCGVPAAGVGMGGKS